MAFHTHAFFLQLIENLQTWDVSANAGVTADLDPRGYGSPFADLDPFPPPPSGFGPRNPYPLADLDRGVQIRWDTGPRNQLLILICCSFNKESFSRGNFQLMLTHKTGKSREITKVAGIKKKITMGDLAMKKVTKVMV